MATCSGNADGSHCGSVLVKCAKCGLVGCTNTRNGKKCTNNIAGSGGQCKNCGGSLKTL